MLSDEFPRLLVIDGLLRKRQFDELQAVTQEEAGNGLISLPVLDAARCMRAPATVRYLATLCVANLDENAAAKRWLAVYQAIGQRVLTGDLASVCGGTPLAAVAEVVIAGAGSEPTPIHRLGKHPMQRWHEAAECALDFQHYDALLAMVQRMSLQKRDVLDWLNFARVLFTRQDCVRRSIEVRSLGETYLLIRQQLSSNVAAVTAVRSKLALFACRAFALAGEHHRVLETVAHANVNTDAYFARFEEARALCRLQRLPESIEKLDELVIAMSRYHRNTEGDMSRSPFAVEKPREFDVHEASSALVDLQTVLKSVDKEAFLVSGTLLGYAREGQLLAHDKDIDVGIIGWEGQFDIAQALLKSGGFDINLSGLGGVCTYHIPIVHRATGVAIDIFIYHPENGKLVTGVESEFGYVQKFAFTPFSVRPVSFLGIEFLVPDDVETKLVENFGNWREPDPCYLSHLESPSTVGVGGEVYQVVARLRALEAMNAANGNKVSRVIDLMQRLSAQPLSMRGEALMSLKAYLNALHHHEVPHAA